MYRPPLCYPPHPLSNTFDIEISVEPVLIPTNGLRPIGPFNTVNGHLLKIHGFSMNEE